MIKNYIIIALRNLLKSKLFSFINIAGLSIGMAGAILLLLWIENQLSIDQFHKKKDYLYKAYNKAIVDGSLQCWENTPPALASSLKQDYPEIKNVARVSATEKLFGYKDKKVEVIGIYTDPAFLNMFSFPLVKGNAQTGLKDAHSIFITEQLSKKIFGEEDPVNKVILADNSDNYTITGVMKNLPENTHFKFEYILPWENLKISDADNLSWSDNSVATFVELQPSADIDIVNSKISDVTTRHSKNEQRIKVFLHPLSKLWLYSRFENGKAIGGLIDAVHLLGIIAVILLLIGCINFMNLSTARSEKRAKEVGIRKVVGALKSSLVLQFIGESILLAFIAGIIALVMVQLTLPGFNVLTEKHLGIAYQSPLFWASAIGFILLTGILAGTYPAFYLSSFPTLKILRGVSQKSNSLATPRKILVISQFVFSVVLINFSIIIQKQLSYSQNRDVGFIKKDLIFHPLTPDLGKNFELVKNELINTGAVISVSKSNTPITRGGIETDRLKWEGMDLNAKVSFELMTAREDFIKTNGLRLLAGRDIDVAVFPTDTASCLINEAALKITGFKNPIGQIVKEDSINWKIVGVIKDFLIGNPYQATKPLLVKAANDANFINIRLSKHNSFKQNVKISETIVKKYNPNYITEIQYADKDYAIKFKGAEITAALANSFALIAIFISCLGLFGLATFMAGNRTKEIGIRKVLGASVMGITSLLAKDFMKLVMIAIVIASPIAWLIMNFFLRDFYYRTNISWWILMGAGAAALFIALFTISFQTIKAAIINPVKSLKTE